MDRIKDWVKDLGFPIVMCIFLIYIVFVTLANNTKAIDNLTQWLQSKTLTITERRLTLD